MRPLSHPSLVIGRYGDPTVYVETLFETHSVLFDLGEIASLSPRRIQRIDQIFVSHAHIDHFVGFDHLLRSLVGRKKTVHLYGPGGSQGKSAGALIDRQRLAGYFQVRRMTGYGTAAS